MPMIKANLSFSFGVHFCVYLLYAALRLLHLKVAEIYTACMYYVLIPRYLVPIFSCQILANMFNNSTQRLPQKVCRSKNGTRPVKDTRHEDAIFDTLCEITSPDNTKSTTLDHHVFDKFTKEWLRRQSKPQPYIRLQMSIRTTTTSGFPSEYHRNGPSLVPWLTLAARVA